MNSTNVFTTDGTRIPCRCATQTASGSIVAAAIDVTSILRGVVGMIIDDTRMARPQSAPAELPTIAVQDNRPTASSGEENAQLSSTAAATALASLDQILSVPGVGAIFLGAGSDLSHSMGVRPNNPQVEAGFQTVLKACKAHNVPCGISPATAPDIAKRVGEGWKMIRTTTPAFDAWRATNPGR